MDDQLKIIMAIAKTTHTSCIVGAPQSFVTTRNSIAMYENGM